MCRSHASPRPPQPTVPSFGFLFNEGFDQPYAWPKDSTIDSTIWTERWSGWALNRQGDVVQPWVVPMVVSNLFQVDPERGTIRFWYRPDYGGETGPGKVAILATLVSAKDGNEATWWSLVVTPDGKEIHLLCQTSGGAESCMKAEINWTAGNWHLLALGFTPTNSAIFIDDQQAAFGDGLPTVSKEAWPFTSLVLGSTLSGADSASGQIEELSTFSGRSKFLRLMGDEFGMIESWDVVGYYAGLSRLASLGPISEEEEAALVKRRAELKAQMEAAGEDGGGAMMRFASSGPSPVCITNGPVFMTNLVSYFTTNDGWIFGFDVLGGTSGVPYDLYCTTNLLGSHITNSFWSFVDSNLFNCTSYTFTNQAPMRTFYILGTTNDTDSDLLTDAYELLVSKTLVSTNDTDGDGMPDGWEVRNGLDPLDPADAGDDPDGDWLKNLQEYNGGTNSTNPRDWMVVAWGDNSDGQCSVPENLRDVKAIAAGDDFSVALKNDGSVVAWGANDAGQTNVPAGLTNAVAISANFRHTVALRTNGSISLWGVWYHGIDYSLYQPSDLTNMAAIAAGASHDLAVRTNGVVTAWSTFGSTPYTTIPTNVVSPKSVAAGYSHSVAALGNGTVTAWGENFGYAPFYWYLTNVPAGLSNVTSVVAGEYHTLALKSDGKVAAWGAGNGGGILFEYGQSIVPSGLSNVTAVTAAGFHSLALRNDGSVVAWGDMDTPDFLQSNVVAIATGLSHGLAIRTGRQTPLVLKSPVGQPELPGANITCTAQGLGLAGVKYQWQFNGVNITGQTNATLTLTNISTSSTGSYTVVISTGAGSVTSSVAPLTLIGPPVITNTTPAAPSTNYLTNGISAPVNLSVYATALGTDRYPFHYQWFTNGIAIANETNSSYSRQLTWVPLWQTNPANADYTVKVWNPVGTNQAGAWTERVISLPKEGSTVAWGSDSDGQIEYPTNLTNTLSIAAGDFHSVAVREDGGVVQWGYPWASVPGDLTNAIQVAAGYSHTIALRANGTVTTWGTGYANTVPTNLAGVKAAAAGWHHNVALLTNGTVTAWGLGELFPGWTMTNVPPGLSNVTDIAAGALHSVVLRSDGTVLSWGYNDVGQTNVPSGLSNVVAVAAGGQHSLALKSDGTVTGWGQNDHNQSSAPAGLSNVMAIAASWTHSAALKNNGTVVCWGDNGSGQTNVPGLLNNVKMIAAGGDHTLAGVFSPLVQYPVDVSKDLLLIYNTTSTNSIVVKDYYLAHRPMVGRANVLSVACTTDESMLPTDFTNQIAANVLLWLANNPTKHPQYIVFLQDMPTKTSTNIPHTSVYDTHPNVGFSLRALISGIRPFVNYINFGSTNDCNAYIDKLAFFGSNYSPGQVVISPSANGYANLNYEIDDVHDGNGYAGQQNAATTLVGIGVAPPNKIYSTDRTNPPSGHIYTATNVAAYFSFGAHSSLGYDYVTNGVVQFHGQSGWYTMTMYESFSGFHWDPTQSTFVDWFSRTAFGGTNYEYTPVAAVANTSECGCSQESYPLFTLWAQGKNSAMSELHENVPMETR